MSKYIRIHSTTNIVVTAGLQSVNMTNPDAHVAERLNVKPSWVGTRTLVKAGSGVYPECLKDWDAVKALAREGILTIDKAPENITDEDKRLADEMQEKIDACLNRYKNLQKATKEDKEHKLADKIAQVKKEEGEGPKF